MTNFAVLALSATGERIKPQLKTIPDIRRANACRGSNDWLGVASMKISTAPCPEGTT